VSDPTSPDHCFIHGVDEPLRRDDYLVCFECCRPVRYEDFMAGAEGL